MTQQPLLRAIINVEALRRAPEALKQRMREAGITPGRAVDKRPNLLRRMHEAGVRVVGGTVAGITPNNAHGLYAKSVAELAAATSVLNAPDASPTTAAQAYGLGERKRLLSDALVMGRSRTPIVDPTRTRTN